MNKKHRNELIMLSQEIYDQASDRLNNYISSKYCAIGNDTMEEQLEDEKTHIYNTSVDSLMGGAEDW